MTKSNQPCPECGTPTRVAHWVRYPVVGRTICGHRVDSEFVARQVIRDQAIEDSTAIHDAYARACPCVRCRGFETKH